MALYILAIKNMAKVLNFVATSGKSGTFKVKNNAGAD
jgi:hypothetical protein